MYISSLNMSEQSVKYVKYVKNVVNYFRYLYFNTLIFFYAEE